MDNTSRELRDIFISEITALLLDNEDLPSLNLVILARFMSNSCFFFLHRTNIIDKVMCGRLKLGYLSSGFVEDKSTNTNTNNVRSIGRDGIRGVRDPRDKYQVHKALRDDI